MILESNTLVVPHRSMNRACSSSLTPYLCIIIVIVSKTSVFNTDASLPYNHDLFESLIVKKKVEVDGEGT
ncbi:hypothetical protein T265_08381 [Opisthorchis viverrini]|uniref:Uncharacterized protein n=1 Tax=Opisthorchis viverrini TaxID=6198 RepID=A0A074Z9P5_OPIVI|nr:hypothetical protein T265_08381 [Opisthorchis viverrini]KER23838.1 hypothetical protein T265_08381 [Opisthorchis viverrini]